MGYGVEAGNSLIGCININSSRVTECHIVMFILIHVVKYVSVLINCYSLSQYEVNDFFNV